MHRPCGAPEGAGLFHAERANQSVNNVLSKSLYAVDSKPINNRRSSRYSFLSIVGLLIDILIITFSTVIFFLPFLFEKEHLPL